MSARCAAQILRALRADGLGIRLAASRVARRIVHAQRRLVDIGREKHHPLQEDRMPDGTRRAAPMRAGDGRARDGSAWPPIRTGGCRPAAPGPALGRWDSWRAIAPHRPPRGPPRSVRTGHRSPRAPPAPRASPSRVYHRACMPPSFPTPLMMSPHLTVSRSRLSRIAVCLRTSVVGTERRRDDHAIQTRFSRRRRRRPPDRHDLEPAIHAHPRHPRRPRWR